MDIFEIISGIVVVYVIIELVSMFVKGY